MATSGEQIHLREELENQPLAIGAQRSLTEI